MPLPLTADVTIVPREAATNHALMEESDIAAILVKLVVLVTTAASLFRLLYQEVNLKAGSGSFVH